MLILKIEIKYSGALPRPLKFATALSAISIASAGISASVHEMFVGDLGNSVRKTQKCPDPLSSS